MDRPHEPRHVLIAKAWPYANGHMHFGHLAALLPADVLARYFRLHHDKVLFVSGSDCHGTPIVIDANKAGQTPQEFSDYYDNEFRAHFLRLGFTHDLYNKTNDPRHFKIAQQIMERLYEKGVLVRKIDTMLWSPKKQTFLNDRSVIGNCPRCGEPGTKGNEKCEQCGKNSNAVELVNPQPAEFEDTLEMRTGENLHLDLPGLEESVREWVSKAKSNWRENAIQETGGWLNKGLQSRACTRHLDWGVPVTVPEFDHLRIFVWFEAVIGYISASIIHCGGDLDGGSWEAWWRPESGSLRYYVHGKDNIQFHTLVFPAMLLGLGNLGLPTHIVSSEFLQIPSGKKFSKSSGYGATLEQYIEMLDANRIDGLCVDALRYFIIAHNPENHDNVFSWTEFTNLHNSALVNGFGNLVNRVHKLTAQHCNLRVPTPGELSADHQRKLDEFKDAYSIIGTHYEKGEFRLACEKWHSLVTTANQFINTEQPWHQVKQNRIEFTQTMFVAWQMIRQLGQLIEPVIPFTATKLREILGLAEAESNWCYTELPAEHQLGQQALLFQKINRAQLPSDTGEATHE